MVFKSTTRHYYTISALKPSHIATHSLKVIDYCYFNNGF